MRAVEVAGADELRVVLIASEAVPFAKTGGLADVAGALPLALESLGYPVTLIVPAYRGVRKAGVELTRADDAIRVSLGSKVVRGEILRGRLPGSNVDVVLIDQPEYFDRSGLYQEHGVDYADNSERYLFFCRAALETIRILDLRPDVLHVNDWQCGLVPVYLEETYRRTAGFEHVGTLSTIHNLAYQGIFPAATFELSGLDWSLFNWSKLEYHGQFGFLKSGLVYADLINTVSPTYAREIQTAELGFGLDGLLRSRKADLSGIVNGIDPKVWNPATDPRLAANYDSDSFLVGKAACKAALQRRAELPERPDVPLIAQIGRLDPQKGWDLLAQVADDLLSADVQMVVLGEGRPEYHELLDRLADRHAGKLRAFLGFLPQLAHQIEAGADLFLMPSRYEPCGLNQLYSLAYGTVPIVRATGGLTDTVRDATPPNLSAEEATGFQFHDYTPQALWEALRRALGVWSDRAAWSRLVRTGMRQDWSWTRSAGEYVLLYEEIRRRRRARVAG